MKMHPGITIYSLILLFFCSSPGFSQTFSENEKLTETFALKSDKTVEINNKYGKIHITTWQKDSVKVSVELLISSNSLSKLRKVRNSIDISFTESNHFITAVSDFGNDKGQLLSELKSLSDAVLGGNNNIEVNYTVYCPTNTNLSLINKFGDIFIDDLQGEIKISLSNGDLKINSLKGESQIELNFGSGIINHLNNSILSTSYSDLKLRKVEKINITSKSSTLNISDAGILHIDSRRDKYYISSNHSLSGNSYFSQLWLEELICTSDLKLKYGTLSIENIHPEFCNINLVSEYGDINLYFSEDNSYAIDIFHNKNAELKLPELRSSIEISQIELNEDEMHSWYQIPGKKALPSIQIKAPEKCYINLIVK